jgi:pSer/pThr/pTyr-binding forkhead associated (FHA) protein
MTRCKECNFDNPENNDACEKCGTPLVETKVSDDDTTIIISPSEVEIEKKEEKTIITIEEMKEEQPALLVLKGPNKGDKFILKKDEVTMGRHPESDIFLSDITVSRNHAKVVHKEGRFTIFDSGSLNGTYLNGKPVDEASLSDKDEIQIGKFKLMFLVARK